MKRLFVFILVIFFGLFMIATTSKAQSNDHVAGQLLVKFTPQTPKDEIDRQLKGHQAQVVKRIDALDVFVVKVPEAVENKILQALLRNPHVEYAEFDAIASAFLVPNDTYFISNQWGLENNGQIIGAQQGVLDADIDAPSAWDVTTGSANIKIAVADTGIDQDHEELMAKIVSNKNFTDSPTVDDLYGHGTHVAGIVAAATDNGIGIAGGCPVCSVMNVKVLNDGGSGAYSWVANGITWSADNGAKVINMSLGGSIRSRTLENAVNYAWNKGVVLAAAAGNSGNQSKTYPAAYTNTIAVAATDNTDTKASFSSYGVKWVDVASPGVNIFSTFPNHAYKINKSLNYDYGSGTSMATPMTSAVAALVWSTSYGTSNANVRNRIESTADKITGTGSYWSKGRVNATSAVTP